MKWRAVLAVCWSLHVLGYADAHIHSQKVQHIEREQLTLNIWLSALLSSALVGVCGVFPLLVNKWVRLDRSCKDTLAFKAILSFAVGGLLGDVFLHLLPEAYGASGGAHGVGLGIGVWVLMGLMSFLVVEKAMRLTENNSASLAPTDPPSTGGGSDGRNGLTRKALNNGNNGGKHPPPSHKCHDAGAVSKTGHKVTDTITTTRWLDKDVSGYLNLVANSIDNFTHGLAIAASYVASPAVGVLTTLAILCHEIPHEIGDFAILLNSGFTLRGAAKAQMLTACGGLVGVVAGLTAEYMSHASTWLLPFTAGGFLYIALVSIVPDLLECVSVRHSLCELLALALGVCVMALVTIIEKKSCGHMPPHLIGT